MSTTQYKQRVRITVLGPKNSGKTAFVYRYLARISLKNEKKVSDTISYDNIYNHCVCLDHVLYDLEIVDLGHPENGAKFEKSSDAFIVVYSLAAREDFETANGICQHLRVLYPEKPVLLVGNKADLEQRVDVDEGHQVSEIHQLPILLKFWKNQSRGGIFEDSLNTPSV